MTEFLIGVIVTAVIGGIGYLWLTLGQDTAPAPAPIPEHIDILDRRVAGGHFQQFPAGYLTEGRYRSFLRTEKGFEDNVVSFSGNMPGPGLPVQIHRPKPVTVEAKAVHQKVTIIPAATVQASAPAPAAKVANSTKTK